MPSSTVLWLLLALLLLRGEALSRTQQILQPVPHADMQAPQQESPPQPPEMEVGPSEFVKTLLETQAKLREKHAAQTSSHAEPAPQQLVELSAGVQQRTREDWTKPPVWWHAPPLEVTNAQNNPWPQDPMNVAGYPAQTYKNSDATSRGYEAWQQPPFGLRPDMNPYPPVQPMQLPYPLSNPPGIIMPPAQQLQQPADQLQSAPAYQPPAPSQAGGAAQFNDWWLRANQP